MEAEVMMEHACACGEPVSTLAHIVAGVVGLAAGVAATWWIVRMSDPWRCT